MTYEEMRELMTAAREVESNREHRMRVMLCEVCLSPPGKPCRGADEWNRVRPMRHGHTKRYNAAARAGVVPPIM